MTLGLVIKTNEGIILASDSLGTTGLGCRLTSKKLYKLNDIAGIVSSGPGELANFLSNKIASVSGNLKPTEIAEQALPLIRREYLAGFGQQPPPQRPALEFIIGGIDNQSSPNTGKIIFMTSSQLFAPSLEIANYRAIGSGTGFGVANYLLLKHYNSNIKIDAAAELAASIVNEASLVDNTIGGEVRVAKITSQGFNEFGSQEIEEFLKKTKATSIKS